MSLKMHNNTSNKSLILYFSKTQLTLGKEKVWMTKKLLLNDDVVKNKADIIILITWLMFVKVQRLFYKGPSNLGEVNSFSSSFSDNGHKVTFLSRIRKTLPSIGLIFKPELLYFKFFDLFKGKGLHMDRNEVFGTWNLILLQMCFKYMFNYCTKSHPPHAITVHHSIKEPILLLWLEGATFHFT